MMNWLFKNSHIYRAYLTNRHNRRIKRWIKSGVKNGYFTRHSMDMERYFERVYDAHKHVPYSKPKPKGVSGRDLMINR